jgi:Sulfotransferase family
MLLSAGGFADYRSETNFFNILLPRFGDLKSPGNRRRLMKFWLSSLLFRVSGLDAGTIERRVSEECKASGDFLPIILGEVARQQGVDRWAECTPEHVLHIPQIRQVIPEALIVHIIRDGRDTALSLAKQGWVRPFPWDKGEGLLAAGMYWEWMVEKGREHGLNAGADYLEVRYEELLRKPRETLGRVGCFIEQELDYDRIRKVAIGSVTKPNTSFDEESRAGEFSPVERWKSRLATLDLARIEALIGGTLEELGYRLASPDGQVNQRRELRRMRATYRSYFESRLWLKLHTPLARLLVDTSLIS